MKHCPNPECRGLKKFGFASEYEDIVEVCAECGVALLPGPAPLKQDKDLAAEPGWDPALKGNGTGARDGAEAPDPDLELVVLHITRSEPELLVLQSLLEAADIPYLCRGEQIQDLFGFGRLVAVNPITGPVEVLVAANDLETAQGILADRGETD